MRKFITKFTLLFLFVFFISSCSNILSKPQETGVTFNISREALCRAGNPTGVAEAADPELTIKCYLYRRNLLVDEIVEKTTLNNINSLKLSFTGVTFGKGYKIGVEIFSEGKRFFAGESNTIDLSKDNFEQNINIALRDVLAPGEVTGYSATTTDGKVSLSWTNPSDEDFKNINILDGDGKVVKSINCNPGTPSSVEFTSLNNYDPYSYTIQTVDKNNNISNGKTVTGYVRAKITKDVIPVEGSTEFVYFGDWPQTLKATTVSIDETQTTTDINGWYCYLGSDNNYYVKQEMIKYTDTLNRTTADTDFKNMPKLSDGTSTVEEQIYYFKLEPIKWKIIKTDYAYNTGVTGKLLVTADVLMTGQFHPNEAVINYETSSIKNTLNGTTNESFINKAFYTKSKSKLLENSNVSNDKVFILSKKEDDDGAPNNPVVTDFAFACGVRWKWIMTRTPNDIKNNCFEDGRPTSSQAGEAQNGCVLPAIVIPNN